MNEPLDRERHAVQPAATTMRRPVVISSLLVPVTIVSGLVVVSCTLRDRRLRALRPWASALAWLACGAA
ncbi:hypothetical protein [Streptomyces sp. MP131-18]|uniref:hypothetical protein n=1 Tax=Streptomyces sp. MP131-18 TaxID=1857892 RepID=UPI00117C0336|nr:hypothetical protein [Streptomyces sp. MP131-18]